MPPEFKVWKEKVDAVEAKKANAAAAASATPTANATSEPAKTKRELASAKAAKEDESEKQAPITYATKQDAIEAFKSLLHDMKVSATDTIKKAQELCQSDPRWSALKNAGERKQALAEYQVH